MDSIRDSAVLHIAGAEVFFENQVSDCAGGGAAGVCDFLLRVGLQRAHAVAASAGPEGHIHGVRADAEVPFAAGAVPGDFHGRGLGRDAGLAAHRHAVRRGADLRGARVFHVLGVLLDSRRQHHHGGGREDESGVHPAGGGVPEIQEDNVHQHHIFREMAGAVREPGGDQCAGHGHSFGQAAEAVRHV